jgi:hypothetical protein
VNPATSSPIGDQARILQCPQMVREERLPYTQLILQFANASFTARQQRENAQPLLIGNRLETPQDAIGVVFDCAGHALEYINLD